MQHPVSANPCLKQEKTITETNAAESYSETLSVPWSSSAPFNFADPLGIVDPVNFADSFGFIVFFDFAESLDTTGIDVPSLAAHFCACEGLLLPVLHKMHKLKLQTESNRKNSNK